MADVAVQTDGRSDSYENHLRCGPYWTSSTVGYVLVLDNARDLEVFKTTDGGQNWSSVNEITSVPIEAFDCWFDGTKIHVVFVTASGSFDGAWYNYLDTTDDSDLASSVQIHSSAAHTAGGDWSTAFCSITKAAGGNLYAVYWVGGEHGFSRSTDAGSTWGARTSPTEDAGADIALMLPAATADNQDACCIYWDRSADAISIKIYDDSGNSWAETAIASSMVDHATLYIQMDASVRESDGHIILAAWNGGPDLSTADLMVWDITPAASPTVTAKTNVITNSDDCGQCAVFIDQNTDDIYVAYLGNESGAETWTSTVLPFYKKSTDGGSTWGSQTAYGESSDDHRWISAGQGATEGRFEPVFFDDDDDDFYVNYGNSVAITGVSEPEEVALAGNQPAATGSIGVDASIALAGAQAAPSGTIADVQDLNRTVSGVQAAPSGAIDEQYTKRNLAGSQDPPSGAVDPEQALERAVSGNQDAPSGTAAQVTAIGTAGNQDAPSGVVTVLFKIGPSGEQDAPEGDVSFIAYIGTSGTQPAPEGDVDSTQSGTLAGNQDPPSGAISTLQYLIALAGNQLAAEGDVSTLYLIGPAGNQAAPSGTVDALTILTTAGVQAAPSGALSLVEWAIAVAGNQPAPEGDLILGIEKTLAGNQAAPRGLVIALDIMAGDQPASTGVVTVVEVEIGYWTRDIRPVRIRVAPVQTNRVRPMRRSFGR